MAGINHKQALSAAVALLSSLLLISWYAQQSASSHNASTTEFALSAEKPVLAVTAIRPQLTEMTDSVSAHGNIIAWQEASIGTEADGLRLTEVRVNVGDTVTKGQLLAIFSTATLAAELDLSRAEQAEAAALANEALADLTRVKQLKTAGALSAQQIQRYVTAADSAKARLEAANARLKTQQVRMAQSRVLAPDQGIISARTATVGAVLPAGQELFRLIRFGRLEWRAEVSSDDLARLKPGQKARITLADGSSILGLVRALSPVVDTQSRNAVVYVDLKNTGSARAGMFAGGSFELGTTAVMTLPLSAVQMRDGFSYVLRITADSRVIRSKVSTGRRSADRIEIRSGVQLTDQLVSTGGAFLGEGDLVRVIQQQKPTTASVAVYADSGPMM